MLAIPLIIVSTFALVEGLYFWLKKQNTEDMIQALELKRKDAVLDFDIKNVEAENEIMPVFGDYDESGTPKDFSVDEIANYKITIIVYNPSTINNNVRNIEVELQNKEKQKCGLINFFPIPILPRNKETIQFMARKDNFGRNDDKIKVTVFSMDNKKVSKEFTIQNYSDGHELTSHKYD